GPDPGPHPGGRHGGARQPGAGTGLPGRALPDHRWRPRALGPPRRYPARPVRRGRGSGRRRPAAGRPPAGSRPGAGQARRKLHAARGGRRHEGRPPSTRGPRAGRRGDGTLIPEYGHFALILAACLSLALGLVPLLGTALRRPLWLAAATPLALGQLVFTAIA